MKKQTKDFLAETISRILGPPVELPVIILILLYAAGLTIAQILKLAPALLFFCWLLPVLFFVYSLKRGAISDLDARNRKERIPTYTVTLLGWSIGLVLAKLWGNAIFLNLFSTFYFLIFTLVIVTYFYKISIHAALNTALFLFVNLYPVGHSSYGVFWNFQFWWLFPMVPAAIWARWYKKNHDLKQLVLGVFAGTVVMLLSF